MNQLSLTFTLINFFSFSFAEKNFFVESPFAYKASLFWLISQR